MKSLLEIHPNILTQILTAVFLVFLVIGVLYLNINPYYFGFLGLVLGGCMIIIVRTSKNKEFLAQQQPIEEAYEIARRSKDYYKLRLAPGIALLVLIVFAYFSLFDTAGKFGIWLLPLAGAAILLLFYGLVKYYKTILGKYGPGGKATPIKSPDIHFSLKIFTVYFFIIVLLFLIRLVLVFVR